MIIANQIEEEKKDEGVLLRSHRYINFDSREIEEEFVKNNEEECKDDKSNVSLVDSNHDEEEKEIAADDASKQSLSFAFF